MNERGSFYIPRIWLIILIIIIVVISTIMIALSITRKAEQQKNEMDNVADMIEDNISEEIDYTKFDEGIATQNLPKIEQNVIADINSTIDGRVPCFYNPIIPTGFKAIGYEEDATIDENAKWGEQNAYLYGLVIEDENHNQFVWVPVENMEIFHTTDWQGNVPKETVDSTYVEPVKEEKEEYYKMYYKVKKYGGFYIGRFETGDLESKEERTTVRNSDSIGIQKYLSVYNYVPFEQSTINRREITGAKELAINFAKQNNYQSVTTSVMYGVQWDAMLRFIVSDTNNVNNSITWGNYTTSKFDYTDKQGNTYQKKNGDVYLIKTGSSEQTKAKNIYDVAGNTYEWTLETAGNGAKVVRGGTYSITIGQLAAARYAYNKSTADSGIGFRISFYID